MNILVVHGQKLENYPPVRNLVEVLTRNNHHVTLVTKYSSPFKVDNEINLKMIKIPDNSNKKGIKNAFDYVKKKSFMKRVVEKEMTDNDILWTTTDSTVRDLGDTVLQYKHVIQLMELIEDIPAYPGLSYPLLHINKYAQKAVKVVVPEYNRAQIQKVWWGLKELPTILPNKMATTNIPKAPENVKKILENVNNEKKKIVLYQGSFKGDRNIDVFAEALESLQNNYVLYIMGRDTPERKAFCRKYPFTKYIPFIEPPYHLLVSKSAYIGLLPYVPEKIGFNSILNALYCAPNKVFEFSGYGVPMLGNDVPGLTIPFETYNIGKTRKSNDPAEIVSLIHEIEDNYEEMSNSCHLYYDSFNIDQIVENLLNDIEY